MGEAAENKILSLLKQSRRDEDSEANKLLKILRNRSKVQELTKPVIVEETLALAAPVNEILSVPGLSSLHLFGHLDREALSRIPLVVKNADDGWLRYFISIYPLMAEEIAGLPSLPVNHDLKAYKEKLKLYLHKLQMQWRLRESFSPDEIDSKELDELLIQATGKLRILVQEGRLQQVNSLELQSGRFTLLCTLTPESFVSVGRFLKGKDSLFAHLAFMVEIMAKEVVMSRPRQLKQSIAVGESMEWLHEKLLVLVHRLAVRSHLGRVDWEDNSRCASLMQTLLDRLDALFALEEAEVSNHDEPQKHDDAPVSAGGRTV